MSLFRSLNSSPSKCYTCLKAVSKKELGTCSDCSEVFCKTHFRVDPKDGKEHCVKCFYEYIRSDVDLEMKNELKVLNNKLYKLKEQISASKKDKNNKTQSIDRLQKLSANNQSIYDQKIETLSRKIKDEERDQCDLTIAIESLKIVIQDSNKNKKSSESNLEAAKDEYGRKQHELEIVNQENEILRSQVEISNKKKKEFVPYTRLKSLACPECLKKIKHQFRQDIMIGNQDRPSLIQSVIASRTSLATQNPAASSKKSVKKPLKQKSPLEGCECLIQ
jgi:hypothetical protein